jgi:hypothetical protein
MVLTLRTQHQRRTLKRVAPAAGAIGQGPPKSPFQPNRVSGTHRPKYLRWALVEAAVHASTQPAYRERYQRTKTRVGKQRGAKIAQVDLARKLAEAIWHMLTRNQPFAPAGATDPWPPDGP